MWQTAANQEKAAKLATFCVRRRWVAGGTPEGARWCSHVGRVNYCGCGTCGWNIGSLLFSVELEMGQAELAGDKVQHGDQIFAGTVAASFAFGGLEHAVEPFHEGVGQPPFPMG